MGVDVIAVSKAKRLVCHGGPECDDSHYPVGLCPKRRDGLKAGCYVVGKGGKSIGFGAGTYSGYDQFIRELALLALGVEPEEVWEHPRRYRGKPFFELIDFPDGVGGTIGPSTSAKLHADFVAFASRARKHFLQPTTRVAEQRRRRKQAAQKSRHVNRAGLSATEELAQAIGGQIASPPVQDRTWMWELYREFRRAFKLASDDGFVTFC